MTAPAITAARFLRACLLGNTFQDLPFPGRDMDGKIALPLVLGDLGGNLHTAGKKTDDLLIYPVNFVSHFLDIHG